MPTIRCLLIVDDDEQEVIATRHKLEESALRVGEVLVARSLAQALCLLTSERVDVILLDLDLADSHSLDTVKAVRAVTDAVVVALAQEDDEVLNVSCLKAGADDFIYKGDVTPERLRKSIEGCACRQKIRSASRTIQAKFNRLTELAGVC